MALAKLPELEARQYTYIGFAAALAAAVAILLAVISMFDAFGVGGLLPWPIPAALSVLLLLVATFSFHKMGSKKVAL